MSLLSWKHISVYEFKPITAQKKNNLHHYALLAELMQVNQNIINIIKNVACSSAVSKIAA